jgi:hypothetical protein
MQGSERLLFSKEDAQITEILTKRQAANSHWWPLSGAKQSFNFDIV